MEKLDTPPHSSRSGRRFGWTALIGAGLASASIAVAGAAWFLRASGPVAETAAIGATYTCPMHPTVMQSREGDCPLCGMKLVPADVSHATTDAAPGHAGPMAHGAYTCPMHPEIVQDHPGTCPRCAMKLVLLEAPPAAHEPAHPSGFAQVEIDSARQQLIGLRTVGVTRGEVGGTWRTTGRVAIDETRVRRINVKVASYVEHVFVDFVGKAVARGEPLFSLYSPELLAAQEELLLALRTRGELQTVSALAPDGDALVAAARRKLSLWDVPRTEIERVERERRPLRALTFRSPITGVVTRKDIVQGARLEQGATPYEIVDLSTIWVLADVYENELRHVHVGMGAKLALHAYPEREFSGSVSFIDPFLDPKTRTLRLRLTFSNRGGELRPEMFGEVVLQGVSRGGLRIPEDALLDSGARSVVFVAVTDGKFEPREIQVGSRSGGSVEVVSGLAEGERVVVGANFMLDSESRLRSSLQAITGRAHKSAPEPEPDAARPFVREESLAHEGAPPRAKSTSIRADAATGTKPVVRATEP